MVGLTQERRDGARPGPTSTEAQAQRGVVAWFRDPAQASEAVEALGRVGLTARRVQRAKHPPEPRPDRWRWIAGGTVGVLVGALLGFLVGGYVQSSGSFEREGIVFVSTMLGAIVVGSFGLFAGFGFGGTHDRPRTDPEGSRTHAAATTADTIVYVEMYDPRTDEATQALEAAGAHRVEEVPPGEELPLAAERPPPGS